jgi:hypothetical protein
MNKTYYLLFLLPLALILNALPLPDSKIGTWDLEPDKHVPHKKVLEFYRQNINEKRWDIIDPKDFIGHDKFNIADGFDADLFMIEEMQLIGDPVRAVENEMNKKRDKEEAERRKLTRYLKRGKDTVVD